MNFTPSRKNVALEELKKPSYDHDLQLYREIPDININLDEFEEWAIERLKVLQILEQLSLKGNTSNYEDFTKSVVQEIKKEGLKHMHKLINGGIYKDYNENCVARKRDLCSHFILRLIYCKSDELRKWFINREIELFKLRWTLLSKSDKLKFLSSNNTNYSAVSEEEHQIMVDSMGSLATAGNNNEYFKVRWTQVLDLVRNRKVYLCDGFAYVIQTDVISGVCQTFRSELSQELVKCFQKFSIISEDERFGAFIKYLHQSYMGKNYSVTENMSTLSINTIDHSSKSFPLCMKRLHVVLRSEHHLKHQARQQYGLFLKGAGLPLEQALVLWRSEFTKKMDADKFDKQYSYNIRHNYGKEGKKVNYTPYSCMKIIMGAVGLDEYHGCPYKHTNSQALKQLLETSNISTQSIQEILNLSQNGHYQIACTKYFEAHNGVSPSCTAINHPNQFFEESQKLKGFNVESTINDSQVNESSVIDDIENNEFDQTMVDFVDKMDE
ncbi:DNA primase large subunit [Acyrthosiphon pisum]|uniref:DNA primase large subunit n=1 Tax=Acyrthosiphon pisum TaxID=7029 RepID=A0A8R1W822_ACYPI|nr:DNA primase large subunit [Acyrthosiphon pisum]|eukprot:XP_003244186.1 PREDICTED: DNA primase large subunit [Acyrthosiphon pisum]